MTSTCLFCEGDIGRDAAVKIINGVKWRLHRCLLLGCANKFNKLSPGGQQKLVEKALEKRQQLSSVAGQLTQQFMRKEVVQLAGQD